MSELLWWFRLRGTVLVSVWWKVLLVIVYTAVVCHIHLKVEGWQMNFPQTLIPIIGVVVGLLLAFRTNSAYDRYWEGRKIWTQMTQEVRKLTRCIWAGVEEPDSETIVGKKSALNLLLAFAIATKHYLREEYSYDFDDLRDLISHLPRFNTPSSNLALDAQEEQRLNLKPKAARPFMAYDHSTPTNIPVELSYYILSYIKHVSEKGLAPTWITGTMQAALNNMVDCLANFERILRTPIPLAYSVHLHYSVWLYILSLPYQIIGSLGWWTIPVVGLGSFCLLGILSIGWEIENPFGYDENDLPLDDFCQVMSREMQMIIGSKHLSAEEWILSESNFPFGPDCPKSALELCRLSPEDAKDILHQIAYHEVNRAFISSTRRKDD